MTTNNVTIGNTDFILKSEEGFFTVWFSHQGAAVSSNVSVHFAAAGIEVTEDRGNAPEPWNTSVTPLRSGAYKVETNGYIERMDSPFDCDPIDTCNEHRDMESFKKSDARIFSAIKCSLEAINKLVDEKAISLSARQSELLRGYNQQFISSAVQVGQ